MLCASAAQRTFTLSNCSVAIKDREFGTLLHFALMMTRASSQNVDK